jgi:nickel-dependent lactate racemase
MTTTTHITFPYGRESRSFELPTANLGEILCPNRVTLPDDGVTTIAAAIAAPIGAPRLAELARCSHRAVIIADDLTRPTPVSLVLPQLLAELNAGGLPDDRIRVVIALGTHRPMTEAEIINRFGVEVVRRVEVVNSEFADKTRLTDCGLAADGTRLWVDRRVMECDLRIGVGTILPHPVAGWGGGAKIFYPGVGGAETVAQYHLQQTRLTRNVFGDVTSHIRANMERWVGQLGLHFIVNVICTSEGRVYRAVAGHLIQAHRRGVDYAKEVFAVRAERRAEIVVVGSYPADLDFWQASKALTSADHLTADGGTIIMVTPCPEGIGPHDELADYVGDDDPDALAERARQGLTADPVAVAGGVTLARMRRRVRMIIVSDGLGPTACRRMQMAHFATVQEALDAALATYGPQARVSVIPHGAEIFPMVE